VLEEASLKETQANDFPCGWSVDLFVYSFVDLQFVVSMFATHSSRFVAVRISTWVNTSVCSQFVHVDCLLLPYRRSTFAACFELTVLVLNTAVGTPNFRSYSGARTIARCGVLTALLMTSVTPCMLLYPIRTNTAERLYASSSNANFPEDGGTSLLQNIVL